MSGLRGGSVALALALSLCAPPVGAASTARFAVVVGFNGAGADGQRPLNYADDDAARMYVQLLPTVRKAWLLTTFTSDSARVFPALSEVARLPSALELARVMGEARLAVWEERKRGVATELLFYFAGHGGVNEGGEGYVDLGDGRFTRADLRAQVTEGSGADVCHVIVDACAAFYLVERGDAHSGSQPLTPELLDVLRDAPHDARQRTGVIVATSDAAKVHESGDLGGGVFSFLLRSALLGGADVNSDGIVEYGEAAAFITQAASTLGDPRARLQVHAAPPPAAPHAALVDYGRSQVRHFLTVDLQRTQRVRLLDARGGTYAEFFREARQPFQVALVGSPFFVVQLDDREAVIVPRADGAYALSALSFNPAARARTAAAAVETQLFATPLQADYVAGFTASAQLLPPLDRPAFVVPYAPEGTPPWRMPWFAVSTAALAGGGLFALLGAGAVVGNLVAYERLRQDFETTRTLDGELSMAVELWRLVALAGLGGAVVLGGAGAGALLLDRLDDAGAP